MSPAPLLDLEYLTCCFLLFSAFAMILSLHIEISQCLHHISLCKSSRIRCLVSMEFKKRILWKILMVGDFTLCIVYEDLPKGMDIWVLCPGCLFLDGPENTHNKISLISSLLLASLLTNCWILAPLFFITQDRIQSMRLQFRYDDTDPLLRSFTSYFNCNIECGLLEGPLPFIYELLCRQQSDFILKE